MTSLSSQFSLSTSIWLKFPVLVKSGKFYREIYVILGRDFITFFKPPKALKFNFRVYKALKKQISLQSLERLSGLYMFYVQVNVLFSHMAH